MSNKHIPETQTITRVGKNNKRETIEIKLLTDDELINYRLLGTAQGTDIFHCLYLAGRYCENFFERVVAYYPVKPDETKFALALCFYEKLETDTYSS